MAKRVVVAMSGGVDSAVAAGLLARQGYDVIGITMRLWTLDDPDAPRGKKRCCSVEDTDDARAAADVLGIPHYVMNMEREFHERVMDYFVAEYGRGRTPNPCLACNEHVKFRALLDRAVALEADYLATGHYARIERSRRAAYRLRRAVDAGEGPVVRAVHDGAGRSWRRRCSPSARYAKSEIRELRARDAPAARGEAGQRRHLLRAGRRLHARSCASACRRPQASCRTSAARRVATHDGIAGFTIGQRRGIGVATGEKRFVTGIDQRPQT